MGNEDNWNLADNIVHCGYMDYSEEDVRTFIKKVKEDLSFKAEKRKDNRVWIQDIGEILDKRAGKL